MGKKQQVSGTDKRREKADALIERFQSIIDRRARLQELSDEGNTRAKKRLGKLDAALNSLTWVEDHWKRAT